MNQDIPVLDYSPITGDCFVDQGDTLAIRAGKSTPDRCVKCNQPAGGLHLSAKLRSPLMMQGGIFYPIFIVAQLFTRPSAVVVSWSVCPKCHTRSRRLTVLASLTAALSAIVFGAGVYCFKTGNLFMRGRSAAGFIMLLAGLWGVVVGIRWWVRVRKVLHFHATDGQHVWLKGAGKGFLQSVRASSRASVSGQF
jgi:hypothetical protein